MHHNCWAWVLQLLKPVHPRAHLQQEKPLNRSLWTIMESSTHPTPLHCNYRKPRQFSCSVMSDSLRPHGLQHARPPCPWLTSGVNSNLCPLSWWCHPLCPLLLPPSIFPSIRVFSNESALHIRWPKNWCFWTVVLEKTLESPLDCKEIQPVHPKGDQPWDFFGRNDAKAETFRILLYAHFLNLSELGRLKQSIWNPYLI